MSRSQGQIRARGSRCIRASHPQPECLEGRTLLTAGELDPLFNGTGYLITSLPDSGSLNSRLSFARSVLVQPDGKILMAGRTTPGDFGLIRLTSTGAFDSTFGSSGRVITDFNGKTDAASDIALLSDGRVLVAGQADMGGGGNTSDNDFALACYLPTGALDSSFGPTHTGKVTTKIGPGQSSDVAWAIAVQADGKIVLAGGNTGATLVRYNPDGSLDDGGPGDTTPGDQFGSGGKVVLQAGGTLYPGGYFFDVAIQADGKIVAAGSSPNTSGVTGVLVARYDTTGQLDTAFDQDGFVVTVPPTTGSSEARALVLRPDGSIVVAVSGSNAGEGNGLLIGYASGGNLDTSFQGGIVELTRAGNQEFRGIVAQPDGKLVVAGSDLANGSSTYNSLLARFLPDGTLDTTFRGGGVTTISASAYSDYFVGVALQSDGRIVAAGTATPPGAKPSKFSDPKAFYVARFKSDSDPLLASAVATRPVRRSLTATQVRPVLARALAYWRAHGADTSRLGHVDVLIADLGGNRLGEASGTTITLDDNAAGWGWDVGRGRKASGRIDLLAALEHEVGHLLGHDHSEGGVMAETLAPGVRQLPADRVNVAPEAGIAPTPHRLAIEPFRAHGRRPRAAARD